MQIKPTGSRLIRILQRANDKAIDWLKKFDNASPEVQEELEIVKEIVNSRVDIVNRAQIKIIQVGAENLSPEEATEAIEAAGELEDVALPAE